MTVLINAASADTSSSAIAATGPILAAVTGTFKQGLVTITADIGSGEATACTFKPADQSKICRLEFTTGVTFKAYLSSVSSDSSVTVEYINVKLLNGG